MGDNNISDWEATLAQSYDEFIAQFLAFLPQLAGAITLLLIGWLVAHALRILTRKLIRSLDSLFQTGTAGVDTHNRILKRSYAVIISKLVFWMIIIFFVAAASNVLGWNMISDWMAGVGIYLPNLITGVVIILASFVLANLSGKATSGAARTASMDHATELGRIVQLVIIFTGLLIGVGQIGINVSFLTNVLVVTIGVLFAGAALAFGLGAKTLVANVIGAQYLRKHCRIGEQIKIGEVEGSIIDVSQTSIVVDTEFGRTVVPAKHFQEQVSHFRSASDHDPSTGNAPGGAKNE